MSDELESLFSLGRAFHVLPYQLFCTCAHGYQKLHCLQIDVAGNVEFKILVTSCYDR